MSRRAMVEELAPVAPPCFGSRLQWQGYLIAATEASSEKGQPSPLIFEAGKPVRFNRDLNFCVDCDPMFSSLMQREGRCHPDWLQRPALESLAELIEASRP